jgi:DEAD/DEAH box helicase domain-containing protein
MKNLVDYLKNTFARNITAEIVLPPEDGDFAPLPSTLNPKLQNVLSEQKLTRLYSHQAEAFDSISHDVDTGLVSRTASGKTLSFLLPILNEYANAKTPFSTLLLYPTKALSRDQEGTLGKLLQAVDAERKFGTFDGDTPPDQRKILQKNADFVITNPDMLHAGFLPNHQRLWKSFLYVFTISSSTKSIPIAAASDPMSPTSSAACSASARYTASNRRSSPAPRRSAIPPNT